jgi:hypothetical protein
MMISYFLSSSACLCSLCGSIDEEFVRDSESRRKMTQGSSVSDARSKKLAHHPPPNKARLSLGGKSAGGPVHKEGERGGGGGGGSSGGVRLALEKGGDIYSDCNVLLVGVVRRRLRLTHTLCSGVP